MSGWTVETVAGIGGTQYRVLDEAGMLVAMFTREDDAQAFLAAKPSEAGPDPVVLPEKADPSEIGITTCEGQRYASALHAELVRRYNAHAALVAACERAIQMREASSRENAMDWFREAADLLRSALASAEGGAL
jgi:hypothetical protein